MAIESKEQIYHSIASIFRWIFFIKKAGIGALAMVLAKVSK
ncbi:MAG: hypothetical protein ACJAWV_003766 [Flammeovirgaceae bacterium]